MATKVIFLAAWLLWCMHCVNSTPHRAHFSRALHAIFLVVCTWLKMIDVFCWMQCLTHSCLHTSPRLFQHLHLVRLPLPRWYTRRWVQPLPPCKEGNAVADWLNNSLSQRLTFSIAVRAANQHWWNVVNATAEDPACSHFFDTNEMKDLTAEWPTISWWCPEVLDICSTFFECPIVLVGHKTKKTRPRQQMHNMHHCCSILIAVAKASLYVLSKPGNKRNHIGTLEDHRGQSIP